MRRILDYIAKYDENLTVAQLKQVIKADQISAKQSETEEIERVKKDFKDVYLKRVDNCDLFGDTLEIYHIKEITDTNKTTDYTLIYHINAEKLSFTYKGVNFQHIKGDNVYHTFSEKDLRGMLVIDKEEFEKYNFKYNEISKILTNLVKEKFKIYEK
jgi:hypothetical protein